MPYKVLHRITYQRATITKHKLYSCHTPAFSANVGLVMGILYVFLKHKWNPRRLGITVVPWTVHYWQPKSTNIQNYTQYIDSKLRVSQICLLRNFTLSWLKRVFSFAMSNYTTTRAKTISFLMGVGDETSILS